MVIIQSLFNHIQIDTNNKEGIANSVGTDQTVLSEQSDLNLHCCLLRSVCPNEPRHEKTNKVNVRPAKTQISLGICPV